MKNINESCFYFIAGHGRGWAFSPSDLVGRFSRQQIAPARFEPILKDTQGVTGWVCEAIKQTCRSGNR